MRAGDMNFNCGIYTVAEAIQKLEARVARLPAGPCRASDWRRAQLEADIEFLKQQPPDMLWPDWGDED